MIKATATDVRNNFGAYLERARRTPVLLQRNGQDTVVILDAAEYKRLVEQVALSSSRERTRRIGFAKGTFKQVENATDKSHLEHFAEYMP